MQLEQAREQYLRQGLSVAAISYDNPAILKNFADRAGIHFPLLSDQGSATIRDFGLLNTQVPESQPYFGVPYPGMFIVDVQGKITGKYFEKEYQERFTPETVLSGRFGLAMGHEAEVRMEHLTLKARLSLDRVFTGNRITLSADVTLPAKMHLYAPGAEGYRPVVLSIEENPSFRIHEATYPPAKTLFLPVIKEKAPVYQGSVRFTRDVTILPKASPKIELRGSLEYQACDDKVCYLPEKIPLTFTIDVDAHDRTRVPEELRKKAPGK